MRNNVRAAPTSVDKKTRNERSFCLMILIRPVINADIPAPKPVSMESAKAGLLTISAKIVPPAGKESYKVSVSDDPMKNNTNMMSISPIDHLPSFVFSMGPPNFDLFPIIQRSFPKPN